MPLKILLPLFLQFLPILGYCQNTIGLPDIFNFEKTTYKAGLQNWDIRQDRNGILYIANNEGLLSFDGRLWELYPLPNKTIVRSVEIGTDGKIYVGGQDELGYFSPGSSGRLEYHSLVNFLQQKDRAFADVWDIASYEKEVFFRTSNRIIRLADTIASVYRAPLGWSFMGLCKGKLYAHDYKNGFYVFENNGWVNQISGFTGSNNLEVTGILPLQGDSLFVTTLKSGLFILGPKGLSKVRMGSAPLLEKERIYASVALNQGRIALATTNAGIFIIDNKAKIIQKFAKPEGLQNNNVLSIFSDNQHNLWLGLDNGIDCIAYNSAIKHITPTSLDGSGYTAAIYNNGLYIGTSTGLYRTFLEPVIDLSFSKGSFTPVPNTSGQVWGLTEINHQLLLAHHEGAFLIQGNTIKPIFTKAGVWNFIPLSGVSPVSKIASGNYRGLNFLQYDGMNFSAGDNIPGFLETSRFLEIDKNDNLWVSHPYHGVYKLSPAPDGNFRIRQYTGQNGLPNTLNNHVYTIRNQIVIATEKGIYQYNEAGDNFTVSPFFHKFLGDQSVRYLKEDKKGNIWFVHEKTLNVLDLSGKSPRIIYLPELTNKLLSGFEFIYPVNANNIFVGGEKGLYHINFEKYKETVPELNGRISAVKVIDKKDSLLFGGYFSSVNEKQIQRTNQIPSIAPNWKTIRFEYTSPGIMQQVGLEYNFRLKGFDDNWLAEWSAKPEKEYTNLPPGTYTFEIKVRNNLGNESDPVSYTFRLLPPWYQTKLAYASYFLTLCAFIYYLNKRQRKKFFLQQDKYEEEQKKLRYLHQLELSKVENELVTLNNEKLRAEIDFKNAELANTAMHLLQKGELLTKIKKELSQITKASNNEKTASELKKMIKALSDDDKMDKDWEHFAQHFDKVHSDFVTDLKEKYPGITPNELKLCTYLRMNLSTKEIAQLMNISVRGVEISRYRLRKKLSIPTEISLFDFLLNLNAKS